MEEKINWFIKDEKRPYYIDLEYQGRIWVNEEIYKEYKRMDWRNWKTNQRNHKCQILNNEKIIRCNKKCEDCLEFKINDISLDSLKDEYDFEVPYESTSIIDNLIIEERNENLWELINNLDAFEKKLILLYLENYSEKEMSIILKVSKTTIHRKKEKIFSFLKNELMNFYKKNGLK